MINNGLDANRLHIVGHSLGGQMSGMIGRKIKEKSNNTIKLKRITALDPAFPPFYPGLMYKPLGKKDAAMVITIDIETKIYFSFQKNYFRLMLYIQMHGCMEHQYQREQLIFGQTAEKHCNRAVQSVIIDC
jgi:pimeloyl-ACP methyl ester carboxylesterase